MPAQKLWLPDFLKDSRPARVGLGVLVPPQVENLDPSSYLEEWKKKLRGLLKKKGDVVGSLLILGQEVLDQYQPNDPDQDDLVAAVRLHPESAGLETFLAYLRKPNRENRDDLLERYPQDPKDDRLNPQEQLEEQKELNLDEFLLSL